MLFCYCSMRQLRYFKGDLACVSAEGCNGQSQESPSSRRKTGVANPPSSYFCASVAETIQGGDTLILAYYFRGFCLWSLFPGTWTGHHGNWRERGCLIVMTRKRGAQEGQEQDIPWTLQWPLISSVLMFLEFFGIVTPDEYLSFNVRVGWHFSFKP